MCILRLGDGTCCVAAQKPACILWWSSLLWRHGCSMKRESQRWQSVNQEARLPRSCSLGVGRRVTFLVDCGRGQEPFYKCSPMGKGILEGGLCSLALGLLLHTLYPFLCQPIPVQPILPARAFEALRTQKSWGCYRGSTCELWGGPPLQKGALPMGLLEDSEVCGGGVQLCV